MRPNNLLGSEWLDQHGNLFRVYSVSYRGDDSPELGLAYVAPQNKRLTLNQLEERHRPCKDGYPPPTALPSREQGATE